MKTFRFKALAMMVIASMAVVGCSETTKPAPASTGTPTGSSTSAPTSAASKGPQKLAILVPNLPPVFGNFKEPSFQPGVTQHVFPAVETLVGMTKEGPAPTKLATSWEIAPDGKSITFKLRQGVKFHDGSDFNADAVKWNIETIKDKKDELKIITSIDVVDPYTVKFNLSEYSNTLLYHLAWYDGCIISVKSYKGQTPEYIASHLIGTGPYQVESYTKDTKVVFKKFADYWDKGKPALDTLELDLVKDDNTAKNALLSGQAQVWDYVPPKEVENFKKQGYGVNVTPGLIRIGYPDSANADSPFAKKEVRYAIEYAVDKKAIADAFGGGTFTVPQAPAAPNTHIGASAVTEGRSYNPAKAKELLAQAGYPQGFKTSIFSQAATNPELLTALQGYYKAVGIDAQIQIVDAAKMSSLRVEGWKNGILIQGLSTSNANYIQALQTDGPSPSKAKSALVTPEYSALLKKAAQATTPAAQKELSEQMVKLTFDEAVISPITVESRVAVYAPSVQNLDLSAFSIWFWNPGNITLK
ncbi:ABC transporter substrate-binding protein [Paenibacillus thalictri]|uniref:Glutathione-binding protein GsiB n=1 Tax=Paenibacillus thalictri TaxID=2527873 RepID=A0A4Q9DRJ1_9BACL|nr:ABC transporter substrate-binding protein [Paenibacillus thalictri]TBL76299.1 ABC transporter substrate-binding protein [Paenibacillus thalictri]